VFERGLLPPAPRVVAYRVIAARDLVKVRQALRTDFQTGAVEETNVARPAPKFNDFIGQQRIVKFLRTQLAGAQARNEAFPHALFSGPSGIGKTYLGQAVAREYGTNVHEAMGYFDRDALVSKLSLLKPNDFLLIDECHRLGPLEQELLIEAIDQHTVPASAPRKGKEKQVPSPLQMPAWTLILATNQPGRLLDALLKRIVIQVSLSYYPLQELKAIAESMAETENVLISPQAARLIAKLSMGLARQARLLLQNLRLHFPDSEQRKLGVPDVRKFMQAAGIDRQGLDRRQRCYLRELARRGSASQEALALALGIDPAGLRRDVEASLVRRCLVRVLPTGRRLSDEGQEMIKRWHQKRQANAARANIHDDD
jgi:holliday junction DNA helicase RuvB